MTKNNINEGVVKYSRRMSAYFILILLAILIVFLFFERNRVVFGDIGFIERGDKFGVSIGDKRSATIKNLISSGFKKGDLNLTKNPDDKNDNSCHGKKYDTNTLVEWFNDETWRSGSICLSSKDDIVVGLSWDYAFAGP